MQQCKQKDLRSAGQWFLRSKPQRWCSEILLISTLKSYKVDPLTQPIQVPPTNGHQHPLHEALVILGPWWGHLHSHKAGPGVRPESESYLKFPCRNAGGTTVPSVRPWQREQQVLGKEGSFAKQCWQRAVFELSISYSFVYFTCSLTV